LLDDPPWSSTMRSQCRRDRRCAITIVVRPRISFERRLISRSDSVSSGSRLVEDQDRRVRGSRADRDPLPLSAGEPDAARRQSVSKPGLRPMNSSAFAASAACLTAPFGAPAIAP
jgi:hypothetical protein